MRNNETTVQDIRAGRKIIVNHKGKEGFFHYFGLIHVTAPHVFNKL